MLQKAWGKLDIGEIKKPVSELTGSNIGSALPGKIELRILCGIKVNFIDNKRFNYKKTPGNLLHDNRVFNVDFSTAEIFARCNLAPRW